MIGPYSPPLSISLIWHPSDLNAVEPILEALRNSFSRDKNKPFSRGLSIPLFFYSSLSNCEIPANFPESMATQHVIIVFTSVNTLGIKNWKAYVESIPFSESIHIVPVAVDIDGLSHGGSLNGLNCIRMYEWPERERELQATVSLAHEVYRFGFTLLNASDVGGSTSIKLFLSHTKAGDVGRLHAERIKQFIDNSNMNRFFDANEISPGFLFDQEIENHIQGSTLLAIETDAYSSRYWCQKELLLAKQYNRPVIIVSCLQEYEDRIFPAASNVPCIHITSSDSISDSDIKRILSSAIIETIRFHFSMKCLEEYRSANWIDSDCALVARPPEIRQVLKFKNEGKRKVCYPEPPIYADEADWHEALGIEAFTPLWNPSEQDLFFKERIGLSISDVTEDDYSKNHLHIDSLVNLSQDLARHLLARSAILLYGGDLRPNGFTEFILDEAQILNERIRDTTPHVENHLAWPLYISGPEIISWRAKYSKVMQTVEHKVPKDITHAVDENTFLSPITAEDFYIWSRCLTEMRLNSIFTSSARICAGGRFIGYKGKMPGVLEEIIITLKKEKPIYLLGAFGGVVGDVCKCILSSEFPETLTEEWQTLHNGGYSDLQNYARSFEHECDYKQIAEVLKSCNLPDLSTRAGLDVDEYSRLMISPFIDEGVHLILKGLRQLQNGYSIVKS